MDSNTSHREDLRVQIREAYGKLVYTYTTHHKHAGRLTAIYKRIKLIQIILSAISTGGILSSLVTNQILLAWIGGVVSTLLLIINLYFKEADLVKEAASHRNIGNELWVIREQYISLLTDFEVLEDEAIMNKRDELQEHTAKIYKEAPLTDGKSYALAQKALKNDEEQFFDSAEIDKMLPEHLREKR